jgi:hypothetical protein
MRLEGRDQNPEQLSPSEQRKEQEERAELGLAPTSVLPHEKEPLPGETNPNPSVSPKHDMPEADVERQELPEDAQKKQDKAKDDGTIEFAEGVDPRQPVDIDGNRVPEIPIEDDDTAVTDKRK